MKCHLGFADEITEKDYLKYNLERRRRVLQMQRWAVGLFSFLGIFHIIYLQPSKKSISTIAQAQIALAIAGLVFSVFLGYCSKVRHKDWVILMANLLINYILIEPNFIAIQETRVLTKEKFFWLGFRISSINLITLLCYNSFLYKTLQVHITIIYLMIRLGDGTSLHNILVDTSIGFLISLFFYNQEKGERLTYQELHGISLQRESWKNFLNFLPEGIAIFSKQYSCIFMNESMKSILQVPDVDGLQRVLFSLKGTGCELSEPKLASRSIKISKPKDGFAEFYDNFTGVRLGTRRCSITTKKLEGAENNFDTGKQEDVFFSEYGGRHFCLKLTHINFDDMDSTLVLISDISQTIKSHVLEENKKYREMLFASFSHEIRTPLNCILLMLGKLIKGTQNLPRKILKNYIYPSYYSGQILLHLVNDILDYSFFIRGELKLNIHMIDIKEECLEILEIISMQAKLKGVQLMLELHQNLPLLFYTDSSRLKQILCHLLLNALKYTFEGRIVLKLAPSLFENCITVAVKDTGIGMTLEEQERLQQVLLMTSPSTFRVSEHAAGASLKTLLTQSLALTLGTQESGGIKFVSQPMKGSKFMFVLQNHIEKQEEQSQLHPLPQLHLLPQASKNEELKSGILIRWVSENRVPTNKSRSITQIPSPEMFASVQGVKNRSLSDFYFIEESMRRINLGMNESYASDISEGKETIPYFQDFPAKSLGPKSLEKMLPCLVESTSTIKFEEQIKASCHHSKILIVDDDEFNIFAAKTILKKKAFSISSARNGAQALALIRSEAALRQKCCKSFQLIIMDVNMPVMGGLEATRILKKEMAESRLPWTPVVGCTAFVASRDETMCRESGMDDYETKPLTEAKLMRVLQKWLPDSEKEKFPLN